MNLLRTRIEKKSHRFLVLCLLVALEFIFGAYLWRKSKPEAILGFLTKNGDHFTIAWRDTLKGYESHDALSIEDAMRFAREELHLSAAVNPISEFELEHVWTQDRFGTYLVMWKTHSINFLNQITFNRRSDAMFFAAAFRQGSYSPSPFGHSVLLLPKSAE